MILRLKRTRNGSQFVKNEYTKDISSKTNKEWITIRKNLNQPWIDSHGYRTVNSLPDKCSIKATTFCWVSRSAPNIPKKAIYLGGLKLGGASCMGYPGRTRPDGPVWLHE